MAAMRKHPRHAQPWLESAPAEQLIQNDGGGACHVEGALSSQHRNPNDSLDAKRDVCRHAFAFVAEHEAHGPARRPLEQVHGIGCGFDSNRVKTRGGKFRQRGVRVARVFPRNCFLGAERSLGNRSTLSCALIGPRRDAAEENSFDAGTVGCSQDRARVVQAAHVVENNDDAPRVLGHAFIIRQERLEPPGRAPVLETLALIANARQHAAATL